MRQEALDVSGMMESISIYSGPLLHRGMGKSLCCSLEETSNSSLRKGVMSNSSPQALKMAARSGSAWATVVEMNGGRKEHAGNLCTLVLGIPPARGVAGLAK